jgi:enoyl-CoA hydratase/carnithine racemase
MSAEEAERWGFYNRVVASERLLPEALALATELATGPTLAHAVTKRCLHEEWHMGVDQAVEAEALAQARCMETEDFARAYRAFVSKAKPVFEGT